MKSPPTFDPEVVKSLEAKLAALVLPDEEGDSGKTGGGLEQPVTFTTDTSGREQKQELPVTAVQ